MTEPLTKKNTANRAERGFSLLELLVVSVILIIILGMIALVVKGLQTSYNERRARAEQLNDGAAALDLLTRVIRVAGANTTSQPLTPTGATQLRVRSDWNPVDGTFNGQYEDTSFYVTNNSLYMRNETTGQQSELMGSVTSLTFQYFDAAGAAPATPAQIARVRISLEVGTVFTRTFTTDVLVRKGVQIK
ncbi:MAG: prepilin-type N-terminal cleavage/methylation domain-containing protein [Acidobacteria bacterium]|nr:prepilin-type N-terminal cleavage/methylation domain-containing protein [Acidobacteriota bacterium]